MPHHAVFHMGLHCLSNRMKMVNEDLLVNNFHEFFKPCFADIDSLESHPRGGSNLFIPTKYTLFRNEKNVTAIHCKYSVTIDLVFRP